MIRDSQLDKQHGKKLEPRWSVPHIITDISSNGTTAWLRPLYGKEKLKKRHLDDIKVYVPRNQQNDKLRPAYRIERTAMALAGQPGTRAVNLAVPAPDCWG